MKWKKSEGDAWRGKQKEKGRGEEEDVEGAKRRRWSRTESNLKWGRSGVKERKSHLHETRREERGQGVQ